MIPLVSAFSIHELKSWPKYFERVLSGSKRCEIRRNDREFKIGDFIHLREWSKESEAYTARELLVRITDLSPGGQFGIDPDFCVMSVVLPHWEAA